MAEIVVNDDNGEDKGAVSINGIPVDDISSPFMPYSFHCKMEAIEFLLNGWQAERAWLLKLRGFKHPGDVRDLEKEERALTARSNELMRKDRGDENSPLCPEHGGFCSHWLTEEGTRICALRERIQTAYGNERDYYARCSYNI
jgi:hypothetical protein